jgi:alcohol dehydrogenase class IV
VYAFATAIFNRYPQVGQGEANTALTPHVLRSLGYRDPVEMCRTGEALGVWQTGMREAEAPARVADHLAEVFARIGMPGRLRDVQVPQEGLPLVLDDSMKNFNADPKREFLEHRSELLDVLRACW